MINLVWFRSDLRIYDNPALLNAMSKGNAVAVYTLANGQWDVHGLSLIKRRLIIEHLIELEEQLANLNVPLIVIDCDLFANIPSQIACLCRELDVTTIYYNHEYEVNEKSCTDSVIKNLAEKQIGAQGYDDQCIIAPGRILNGSGECYKVFSAFAKNWSTNVAELARPLYSKPEPQKALTIDSDIKCLQPYLIEVDVENCWPVGEIEAHDRLNDFIEQGISNYHTARDFPDLNATSQLSIYLALGILTTRQCLQSLINFPQVSVEAFEVLEKEKRVG